MVFTVVVLAASLTMMLPPQNPLLEIEEQGIMLQEDPLSRGSARKSGEVKSAGLPLLPEQDDYGSTRPSRRQSATARYTYNARPP